MLRFLKYDGVKDSTSIMFLVTSRAIIFPTGVLFTAEGSHLQLKSHVSADIFRSPFQGVHTLRGVFFLKTPYRRLATIGGEKTL